MKFVMGNISFDEIKDGHHFEALVETYFKQLQTTKENQDFMLLNVETQRTGVGADGGVDILVDISIRDGVETFKRRWVVQCKFSISSISTTDIYDTNIPTLIHANKATGYLLICRSKVTSKLTDLFKKLDGGANIKEKCKMGYSYKVWDGQTFLEKILERTPILWQQYFPEYYKSFKTQ
jgi:predicted helicase